MHIIFLTWKKCEAFKIPKILKPQYNAPFALPPSKSGTAKYVYNRLMLKFERKKLKVLKR